MTKSMDSFSSFKNFLGLSLVLHILVILIFSLSSFFFKGRDIVIPSAIRVDLVALPEKTKPKTVSMTKKQTPKITLKKTRKKQKTKKQNKALRLKQEEALRRLKAQEALNKIKKAQEAEALSKIQSPPQSSPSLRKGNIISSGDQFKGLERLQFEEYFSKMKTHLHTHWNLPQWLANDDLKAQAQVQIDERGFVIKKQLIQSSGNTVFDQTVLKAIDDSSPFPAPPKELQKKLTHSFIIFNFPD